MPDKNSICKVPIVITETLDAPVNFYYNLTNFFLNQRDLTRSRSFSQLRNKPDSTNFTKCNGALFVKEMFDFNEKKYTNQWKFKLVPNSIASPCGLAAKSFFNGKYNILN